jgi:hypothetical protein
MGFSCKQPESNQKLRDLGIEKPAENRAANIVVKDAYNKKTMKKKWR